MTELTPDSIEADKLAIAQAGDLLTHYSFDLGNHTITQLIDLWLQEYPAAWVRLAVIEALYQGRYKAISVQQILQFWHRRGLPLHHFNGDFDRLICHKIPRNFNQGVAPVSTNPPPQWGPKPSVSPSPSPSSTVLPILPITHSVPPPAAPSGPSPRWAMLANPVPLPPPPTVPTPPSTDVTSADRRSRRRSVSPPPASPDVARAKGTVPRPIIPVPSPSLESAPSPTDATRANRRSRPELPPPSASPAVPPTEVTVDEPLTALPPLADPVPPETTSPKQRFSRPSPPAAADVLSSDPLTLPPIDPPDLSHVLNLPAVPPPAGMGKVPTISPKSDSFGPDEQRLTPSDTLEVSLHSRPSIQASVAALMDKANSSLTAAADAGQSDLGREDVLTRDPNGAAAVTQGASSAIPPTPSARPGASLVAADFHAKLKAVAEQQQDESAQRQAVDAPQAPEE
jgi:hypothetical protein